MKSTLNQRMSTLFVSIFIMVAQMPEGMGPILPGANTDRGEFRPSTTVGQDPILLAAEAENTVGNNAQGAAGADDQVSEPEPGSETDKKESSAGSKPAPLKSFKPSEEIAAEQAVDFPVDI